ncbi:hypothetical protein A3G67_03800 [Candidatus Roizmanbacteria bacterium RIFCSPLOWO2_12_FULL_40_12]|uniref:Uncharacterized protein n=1 Tax=Candidatus Roizmanbacteria bacterium RIFCSPLOWO2_01_FULL_40_42 TaxID=1802066 RepID=A0A1F7J5Q9_9BACT|nr:MAG: hypothetical protein A2779_03435 [Candidatus Roizmanbacteria bacterium RIFCSPHIGHO2_01_FULL_40_98]OGK28388.1 MAG: hypothetical protein A3C31_00800 [Candidatus Roizmanbacteria bacterium RIFCSPHIGHO2_02_FULL_40_53]OGK30624.1 MAG: hypothetical protein A2W49_03485 [Candidatus Roizmanbacteria bacterium RIFCSPHIGHO2_12_41_18]OGK37038.1 MAG: hypothetical protein A3E69_01060 [Candidatus Roizmanbacteria bacterium RIFCSPHIGHO2_12_FULL_40_130]OGK50944.1 MAG: hypothetical protein A3B50_01570 [Candi
MEKTEENDDSRIQLSKYTIALLENLKLIKSKPQPDETSRITVSQTASFFALAYEKIRNAVEYRESHLIRKSAIDRMIRRRLALNPEAKGEAENLIRELLWARYFSNESLGIEDVSNVQNIIDKYLFVKKTISASYSEFVFDLMVCEIEEVLSPAEAKRNSLFTFFLYQVLKNKVKMDPLTEEQKNIAFYVALEKTYSKSDTAYLRFHLFALSHKPFSQMAKHELSEITSELPVLFDQIDKTMKTPSPRSLNRFIKNQSPPFLILFEIMKRHSPDRARKTLEYKKPLWQEVWTVCKEKYSQTQGKLTSLAIRAIIYIFVTKMIFALILEYPVSLYIYNEVNYTSLAINSLFPPFLMFLIIALTRLPNEQNTKRINERLIDIVDADKSFETSISFVVRKVQTKRPVLVFFFTIFYLFTFFATFNLLHLTLNVLRFNMISQIVFVFFVSLVAFFSYRISQIAKEYKLREKESFFQPFADFFFLPFLSVGKFFSTNLARLNFFGVLFDFFIEAPFKIIVEVIEEWVNFARSKREEIA